MTQQRVINLAANVSNNIDATAARLLNIADRLDRRIAKISAQNLPVERASALVAEARSQLENVAGALYLIDTAVYTMATAENPAAQWPTIRNRYLTAQTGLRDTKAALQQAISALQDPTPTTDITPDATSTPPTNTP